MKQAILVLMLASFGWAHPALGQTPHSAQVGGRDVASFLPVPAATEKNRLPIDPKLGYWVGEVADRFYVITDGVWQSGFLVTDEGVVVFDAPASYGNRIPQIIRSQTDQPISHLIYSHAHKDHIAGSPAVLAAAPHAEIIAHERVAAYLLDIADPLRPLPTRTFSGSVTLLIGGERIQIDEVGPYHSTEADLFISLPRQRVLYAIDAVAPGWVTFQGLDVTVNTHNYLAVGHELMARDWDLLVPGHLTQLGTRDQVAQTIEYTNDVLAVATDVFTNTDMMATMGVAAADAGWSNPFLLFRYYQEAMVNACSERLVALWGDRLAGVDVFAPSHCDKLLVYLRVD